MSAYSVRITGMSRTPNHIQADAMRAAYEAGASLGQIAEQFGCTRQSVYVIFKRRGWTLRPKPPARRSVEWNGARYSLRNNGYMGRTTGQRTMLHRDVWSHTHGQIPEDHDIHHVDHDRMNNDISNLELISKSEHAKLHAAIAVTEVEGT